MSKIQGFNLIDIVEGEPTSLLCKNGIIDYEPLRKWKYEKVNPLDPLDIWQLGQYYIYGFNCKIPVSPEDFDTLVDFINNATELIIEFNQGKDEVGEPVTKQFLIIRIKKMPECPDDLHSYREFSKFNFEGVLYLLNDEFLEIISVFNVNEHGDTKELSIIDVFKINEHGDTEEMPITGVGEVLVSELMNADPEFLIAELEMTDPDYEDLSPWEKDALWFIEDGKAQMDQNSYAGNQEDDPGGPFIVDSTANFPLGDSIKAGIVNGMRTISGIPSSIRVNFAYAPEILLGEAYCFESFYLYLWQNCLVANKVYVVYYHLISIIAGKFTIRLGTWEGKDKTSAGRYCEILYSNGTELTAKAFDNFRGSLGYIYIYSLPGIITKPVYHGKEDWEDLLTGNSTNKSYIIKAYKNGVEFTGADGDLSVFGNESKAANPTRISCRGNATWNEENSVWYITVRGNSTGAATEQLYFLIRDNNEGDRIYRANEEPFFSVDMGTMGNPYEINFTDSL